MKWVRKMVDFFKRRSMPKDPPVSVDQSGFSFTPQDGHECRVRWSDIHEIRAFKLDLLTWDEVRFTFRVAPDLWIDISEEQAGFDDLVTELESRFPTVRGWQAAVIKPDFTRNETVLYSDT